MRDLLAARTQPFLKSGLGLVLREFGFVHGQQDAGPVPFLRERKLLQQSPYVLVE
jgi:hypothetical protein